MGAPGARPLRGLWLQGLGRVLGVSCGLLLAGLPAACRTPGESTRTTVDDLAALSASVAASLEGSSLLSRRGPESEPWVWAGAPMRNLSTDVMTRAEQASITQRVLGGLPLRTLAERRNLVLLTAYDREAVPDSVVNADRLPPTHRLQGTLRAVTRAVADGRSDLYLAAFELLDLRSGAVVWTDRFEFKRVARGLIWD